MRLCTIGSILVGALTTGAAQAPTVTEITPIFHQLVAISLPKAFQVNVPEQNNGKSYLRESVLRGETPERWTQMITLTGAKGAAASGVTSQRMAAALVAAYRKACAETFAMEGAEELTVSGLPATRVVVGCGSVPSGKAPEGENYSESAMITVIAGDEDIYTVQWAERGQPLTGRPVFDRSKWQERFRALSPIRVCARVEGEAAPYPSCVGK